MELEAQHMKISGRGCKDPKQSCRTKAEFKGHSFYIKTEEDDCNGTEEKNKATM